MSVLAYCVAASEMSTPAPAGVDGAPVQQASIAGLLIYFSSSDSDSGASCSNREIEFRFDSDERIREGALAFHRVNDAIFREAGIVPFRFPTLLPGISELEAFVEHNREIFAASLEATRDCVQMEVWIYPRRSAFEVADPGVPGRGLAYLQEKAALRRELEVQAEAIRQLAANHTVEWKQAEQRDCLRCYALVARRNAEGFRGAASASLPGTGPQFRVTGPWPPTHFMPLHRLQPVKPLPADLLSDEAANL